MMINRALSLLIVFCFFPAVIHAGITPNPFVDGEIQQVCQIPPTYDETLGVFIPASNCSSVALSRAGEEYVDSDGNFYAQECAETPPSGGSGLSIAPVVCAYTTTGRSVAPEINSPIANYSGLVPCGRDGQGACQMCHTVQLVNGVTAWLVGILSIAAAIMFVIAGFRLVTANGNPSVMQDAKNMITNVAIGFAIVLAAWLLIDLMMKTLLGGGSVAAGPWNQIACIDQPTSTTKEGNLGTFKQVQYERAFGGFPTPDSSRGTAYGTGATINPTILAGIANLSADEADAAIAAAGAQAGLDARQIKNIQALMRVESGGCRNLVSSAGALGCMQIMPGTAVLYDPALSGMSEAAVRQQLLDPGYNIALGVQIYNDLYDIFDGDEIKVFAAYNGGENALAPSVDCPATGGQPALARYQCVWDSPGCYGTSRTDCVPNTGYIETRNYIQKIPAVARQL